MKKNCQQKERDLKKFYVHIVSTLTIQSTLQQSMGWCQQHQMKY